MVAVPPATVERVSASIDVDDEVLEEPTALDDVGGELEEDGRDGVGADDVVLDKDDVVACEDAVGWPG